MNKDKIAEAIAAVVVGGSIVASSIFLAWLVWTIVTLWS
jgi:hypothetical protein